MGITLTEGTGLCPVALCAFSCIKWVIWSLPIPDAVKDHGVSSQQ